MPTPTKAMVRGETAIPVLDDVQVIAAVSQREALDSIRDVLLSAHRGTARSLAKTMAQWDEGSTAHSLGAVDSRLGLVAFKSWVNTPRGAAALLSVFDAVEGRARAVMSAGALGFLRTAGTAAVATDMLAVRDAQVLGLLGTGRQAKQQIIATNLVRPLELVRVWSPNSESRSRFAQQMHNELGIRTECVDSAEAAVRDAPIVTAVTRAQEPFLEGGWLAPGAHLNAVGAILPSSAELLPSVLPLSDLTVVDDLENARRSSRELKEHLGDDLTDVATLGQALDQHIVRPPDARLTVFKGLGSGLTDLAVAAIVIRRIDESAAEDAS